MTMGKTPNAGAFSSHHCTIPLRLGRPNSTDQKNDATVHKTVWKAINSIQIHEKWWFFFHPKWWKMMVPWKKWLVFFKIMSDHFGDDQLWSAISLDPSPLPTEPRTSSVLGRPTPWLHSAVWWPSSWAQRLLQGPQRKWVRKEAHFGFFWKD